MKLWHIAMFIFVFNLTLNMLVSLNTQYALGFQETTSGVNGGNYGMTSTTINNTEEALSSRIARSSDATGTDGSVASDASWLYESIKLAIGGIWVFGQTVVGTAVFTEATINNITGGMLPVEFLIVIGLVVRLVFIAGIVQLLFGKSFKEME